MVLQKFKLDVLVILNLVLIIPCVYNLLMLMD